MEGLTREMFGGKALAKEICGGRSLAREICGGRDSARETFGVRGLVSPSSDFEFVLTIQIFLFILWYNILNFWSPDIRQNILTILPRNKFTYSDYSATGIRPA